MDVHQDNSSVADAPQRPRLVLKPRDESAARKAELERQNKLPKASPFGNAKPREAVLAQRTGKSEEEILREAVKADRTKLRLSPAQLEEKLAAETAIAEVKERLSAEEDPLQKSILGEDLKARENAFDQLLQGFEKLCLEAVARGEFVRPSERKLLPQPDSAPARDAYKPRSSHQEYRSSPGHTDSHLDRRYQGNIGRGRRSGTSDLHDIGVSRAGSYHRSGDYGSHHAGSRGGQRYYNSIDGYSDSKADHTGFSSFGNTGRKEDFIGRGQYPEGDFGSAYGSTYERRGGSRGAGGFSHKLEWGCNRGSSYQPSGKEESYKDYPGMGPPVGSSGKDYKAPVEYHSPYSNDELY